MLVRLQKLLSQANVTSRRKGEELIQSGRVTVNGKVIRELGSKADPDKDRIEVDGKRIEPKQPKIAVLLYKPDGYITSMKDPEGRPTVTQLVDSIPARLFPARSNSRSSRAPPRAVCVRPGCRRHSGR